MPAKRLKPAIPQQRADDRAVPLPQSGRGLTGGELAHDRLEGELEAARVAEAQAEAAVRTAEELRQVEEERKARGQWQRLRSAWRGE